MEKILTLKLRDKIVNFAKIDYVEKHIDLYRYDNLFLYYYDNEWIAEFDAPYVRISSSNDDPEFGGNPIDDFLIDGVQPFDNAQDALDNLIGRINDLKEFLLP